MLPAFEILMGRAAIRPLRRHDEFLAAERLQRLVWGALGVSSEVMTITEENGGVVLGALVGRRLVGFLYAFLARRHGRLMHWSHMMAVEPGFRDRRLGFRMKLAHRHVALRQGLRSIGWTFDPLQSRNAALNLARLGARAVEYRRDVYGEFPSRIEKRLPSDRFVVGWAIDSLAVERRLKIGARRAGPAGARILSLPRANETRLNSQGLLQNRRLSLFLHAPRLLVEIPSHTDEMRRRNLALARQWRVETRRIFECYLARGFRVEDFIPPHASTAGRCFYLLRRHAL